MDGLAEDGKKRPIDDIIEHMTADLQSYDGQYLVLGSPPSQSVWPDFESQSYYRHHAGNIGGGSYVVFSKPNQEYQQPVGYVRYGNSNGGSGLLDYSTRTFQDSGANRRLIENVVGNWVPNRNGTYSPFGGSPEDSILPTQEPLTPLPSQPPVKKRMVAEVKPMRPSYSDVLSKSPPLTPPPVAKQSVRPIKPLETIYKTEMKKTQKVSSIGVKPASPLKRQNSSGSEETLVEKPRATVKRWSSTEEFITTPLKTNSDDKKKEKKRKNKKTVIEKEESFQEEEEVVPPIGVRFHKVKGPKKEEKKGTKDKQARAKAKKSQRVYRRREKDLREMINRWSENSSYYLLLLTSWLLNLLWNVTALSTTLLIHLFGEAYVKGMLWVNDCLLSFKALFKKWWGKKEKKKKETPTINSLNHNITLPTTGDEAMKRLLSCKGKDPYSILGVTSTCTDDEIKKYYKSQALLVHPDKNSQPGAEEAFKILVHAFDLIAEPDKRAAYDRYVAETNQVEQAWSELSNLLSQLHEKMEYAANTIRCNNCGKRHKRELTNRPCYAARYCAQCKIRHSARESDMWAESRGWGWWRCRYYACMDGAVYDITQWANCQGNAIQKVKPDSHDVQYRVLLGRDHHPPPEPDIDDIINSLFPQDGRTKKKSKKNK